MQCCNAMSNFDNCQYIHCVCAEFATKHTKAPISLITRWKMEPDFGSWQTLHARYIALLLISRYQCLDPTNHNISRVHCIMFYIYLNASQYNTLFSFTLFSCLKWWFIFYISVSSFYIVLTLSIVSTNGHVLYLCRYCISYTAKDYWGEEGIHNLW